MGLSSGSGTSDLYQTPRKAISIFFVPASNLPLQCSVAGGPPPAWAPRRAMRSRGIHSVLVRAGVVPICKRSRIVRVGIREGWYPANIDVHLSWARVPGILGESGWAYRAAGASPIYANPIGTRFCHFRAVMETSRGRIATLWGTCRPRAHGPRCARLTSILGRSGAVEHAGEASHVSFPVGLHEGWYPANTEIHLSRTRVPAVFGARDWVVALSLEGRARYRGWGAILLLLLLLPPPDHHQTSRHPTISLTFHPRAHLLSLSYRGHLCTLSVYFLTFLLSYFLTFYMRTPPLSLL